MAGGGLYALVAYGTQNVILSGNPQMTYFYKAFKRYTHFAMENIRIPLEGINEPSYNDLYSLRAKIPRYGDLLSDLMLTFRIPDIYSKYVAGRSYQYEFQWVRYIGAAIINRVGFYIGGQRIQELEGSYILAQALLDQDQDSFQKWRILVGDTDALIAPANSEYASYDPTTRIYAGYPTVTRNGTPGATQVNRPSIFGRDIHVPLSFWFSEAASKALPLIGLQYHECEIQLTLNPINELYTLLDTNGLRVSPKFTSAPPPFTQNAPLYVDSDDTNKGLTIKNFLTDFDASIPDLDTWQTFRPELHATFIYLPREEQIVFATRPLSYLVTQTTNFPFYEQTGRAVLDLQTHNPLTRILFVQRRSDSYKRNDFANFTNWYTYPAYPFSPTPSPPPGVRYTSGVLVPAMQQQMIRGIHIICDGNEIQEMKPTDFFTDYSVYKYAKGTGQPGLPLYSFQLHKSATQPSGSINASRIRNFQIDMDMWPLPVGIPYKYNIDIYVDNINFLEIVSGMGGLKYAL
jgi:hypothetical protein